MGFFSPSKKGGPDTRVKDTVEALQALQKTLHVLTPAEQQSVKGALPFAAAEWLDGLALSIRAQNEGVSQTAAAPVSAANVQLSGLAQSLGDEARIRLTPDSGKIVICLVGLPARGKSLLCHKLEHFLCWRGSNTKSFRVGQFRRGEHKEGAAGGSPNGGRSSPVERAQFSGASFFDSTKAFAMATREAVSLEAFDETLKWLAAPESQVAIFDASNVTIQRRAKLQEKVNQLNANGSGANVSIVFLETICIDQDVIRQQMLWKVRNSNDFVSLSEDAAMADLSERISHYEKVYQTVREDEGPYIKMYDLRAKASACNIYGRMAKSVLPFLLAMHAIPRPIFLFILPSGDEADASQAHRAAVCRWAANYSRKQELLILTSTEPRALATAEALADASGGPRPAHRPMLAPWHEAGGDAAGSTSFRAKFGTSVTDLVVGLEPLVLEVEGATSPVIIVAQEAPCRTLRAYFVGSNVDMKSRESVDQRFRASPDHPQLVEFAPREPAGLEEKLHDLA